MIELLNTTNLFPKDWVNTLKNETGQAEKQGKLTSKQVGIINEQGWFKALVPAVYGGKQMSLPDLLKLEEALAYVDGSVGWVVTLCAGAGWFGGFTNESTGKSFFSGNNICIAGSGSVNGTAEMTSGGYTVSGKWPYASGTPHATAFTANCVVTKNGSPVKGEDGSQKVLSFIFTKKEITVLDEWNAFGMVATASHSFEVKDLKVAADRAFDLNAPPVVTNALYHYPFLQLAECTLSINMTGMALHFMELCGDCISNRFMPGTADTVQDKYDTLLQKLEVARQKLFYAVDMSWQVCQANKEISSSLLYKVTAASYTAVNVVKDCVNTLYPFCGLKSADKNSEINRVWRDIQTAGQHSLLAGIGN